MDKTTTSFGALLRHYRAAAGFTQEALAARAQISARTIADLERGINRVPRHDTFELLMSALDLTAQQRALFLALTRPKMTATALEISSQARLPLPPTPLIGRAQEVARGSTCLRSEGVRLLTLTGPAGIGKTRLGLQKEHYRQAARLCAAAVTMREQVQTPLPPSEREAFEQVVEVAKTTLDEQAFREEWAMGAKFAYNQAIDYALLEVCTSFGNCTE